MKLIIIIFLLWTTMSSNCVSQSKPSSLDTVPLNSAVRRGVLSNGFTYYILKNAIPNNKIDIALIQKAGYRQEEPGELGVAHLLEHLSFRSTVNFPKGLSKSLVSLGLKLGTNFNARTTGASTTYDLNIPSGDSVLLKYALLAIHDWAKGRLYIPEEVEQERSAVMRERSEANVPAALALFSEKYLQLEKNPLYAVRVQEEIRNIENVSIETLNRFDRKWYRPDKQAIIIVGDVDEVELERQIRKMFSVIQTEANNIKLTPSNYKKYEVPLTGKDNLLVVGYGPDHPSIEIKVMKKQKSIISIGGPITLSELHVKFFDELYNELVNRRFVNMNFRQEKKIPGLVHYIKRRAVHELAGIDATTTYITIDNLTDARKAIQFVTSELFRIERWGFSEKEFIRAKEKVLENRKDKIPDSRSLKLLLVNHFENKGAVPANEMELYEDWWKKISMDRVNTMIKCWFSSKGNTDFLFSVPDEKDSKLPTQEQVFKWVKEVRAQRIKKYEDKKLAVLPRLAKGKKDIAYTISDVRSVKALLLNLPNGVEVLLKPISSTSDRKPAISVQLKGFATSEVVKSESESVNSLAAAKLMEFMGAGPLNSNTLKEWIRNKRTDGHLEVMSYWNSTGPGIQALSSLNNYEALLQLVYWCFVKPQLNKNALERSIKMSDTQRLKRSQYEILDDSIQSVIDRSTVAFTDRVLDVSLMKNIFYEYKKQFSNATNFKFVITGYFDVDSIKELTARYLGSLPSISLSTDKSQSISPLLISSSLKPYEDKRVSVAGDSIGDVNVRVLFPIYGPFVEVNRVKLLVLKEMLGPLLSIRLREKEKGVYAVILSLRPSKKKDDYFLDIGFQAAPQDVERLIVAIKEEISTFSKRDIDDVLFNNAITAVRVGIKDRLKMISYWSDYLEDKWRKGNISADIFQEKSLNTITPTDIQESAKTFIDTNHYMLFKQL